MIDQQTIGSSRAEGKSTRQIGDTNQLTQVSRRSSVSGLVHEHGRLEPHSLLSPEPMEADECVGDVIGVTQAVDEPTFYRNCWAYRAGFCHGGFLPPILHRATRKLGYLQNKGTSVWNFSQTLDFENFATAIVDRVVNKTCRRSSLLTASTTVEVSGSVGECQVSLWNMGLEWLHVCDLSGFRARTRQCSW